MNRIVLFAILAMVSSGASANPWKNCGLGHWIAGGTWDGALAITTNITWDLGTTATISQVSSPGTCSGPSFAAAKFINESYPSLEQDTANGNGEHLVAMMDILQCDKANRPLLVSDIRHDFSQAVSQSSYSDMANTEKAEQYFTIVMKYAQTQCDAS